jgi:hypothetical protein
MVASLIAGVIAWRVEAAAEHDEAEIRRKDGASVARPWNPSQPTVVAIGGNGTAR